MKMTLAIVMLTLAGCASPQGQAIRISDQSGQEAVVIDATGRVFLRQSKDKAVKAVVALLVDQVNQNKKLADELAPYRKEADLKHDAELAAKKTKADAEALAKAVSEYFHPTTTTAPTTSTTSTTSTTLPAPVANPAPNVTPNPVTQEKAK